MNEKESQRTHAIYLDRDPVGNSRISITLARRGRRGAGKRIKSITGRDRDVAFPHLSTILWNHHGKRLETEAMDLPPGEYHPISEVAATQMLLLMDAVKEEPTDGAMPRGWLPPSPTCTTVRPAGGGPATRTGAGPGR